MDSEEGLNSYGFIVPSRNRPAQLYALLRTYSEVARLTCPLKVLWRADAEYRDAYLELIEEVRAFGDFYFIEEENFGEQWTEAIRRLRTDRLVMLVDDDIFLRECPLSVFDDYDMAHWVPNLRFSSGKTWSYTAKTEQVIPVFTHRNGLLEYAFQGASCDWAYIMSVDGHIFDRCEMLAIFEKSEWKCPLPEVYMQSAAPDFADRCGVCFEHERLVCIQANDVQTEYPSVFSGPSAADLLGEWNVGNRIWHEDFIAKSFPSVHIDGDFRYGHRETAK